MNKSALIFTHRLPLTRTVKQLCHSFGSSVCFHLEADDMYLLSDGVSMRSCATSGVSTVPASSLDSRFRSNSRAKAVGMSL